jgi:CRP-like cAMP-binding protein
VLTRFQLPSHRARPGVTATVVALAYSMEAPFFSRGIRTREGKLQRVRPKVSQEMLAEMVGTTRSRVNFFMNKFRELGFIKYNGGLQIDNSLLSVVLHE